jgi:PelA/Pel-15E family pectate lyase
MKRPTVGRTFRFGLAIALLHTVSLHAESPAAKLLEKPDSWFRSEDGQRTLDNILSWQTAFGDWPKNNDTVHQAFPRDAQKPDGSFDNGATTGELRVVARAYRLTGHPAYQQAFVRGFQHILKAQYAHGGWPQFYPLSQVYHRHVTFNDGSMIRLMEFLRDASSHEDFGWLDGDQSQAAKTAVERGIECILRCQVVVDDVPTVWCAQHHAETLEPVGARSFELASLSGAESAEILLFLMAIEDPSPSIVRAVQAGVAWFQATAIRGYRYRKSETEPALVQDPAAPPLWARFYELQSNRPIFSDRDGVKKYDIEQIGMKIRSYSWYGTWGSKVLDQYARWEHRQ